MKKLILANIALLILNIFFGSVHIPADVVCSILSGNAADMDAAKFIVLESRLPAAITAMLTGGALGACGLLLQSFFRNPLAGPSILGITSGANLVVAIITLATGVTSGFILSLGAMAGALGILLLLLALSHRVRHSVTLLITGILISYLTSAIITLLNYHASAQGVQSLMLWGMGSFMGVGLNNLIFYSAVIAIGLSISITLIRPLNAWMLGTYYAQNLGISISRTRKLLLISAGLLAAVTTAFCGPIAFVGLSVPHIAQFISKSDDHRILLPRSILIGSLVCMTCLLISTSPNNGYLIPINALTPLFGIPVIIYILFKGNTNE